MPIKKLYQWLLTWEDVGSVVNRKNAVLLYGPPGIGKSSAALPGCIKLSS